MFNAYVNKGDVIKHLKEEIKTISQRWASFMVNKIALEKESENWEDFTEEEVKLHAKMKKATLGKEVADQQVALNKFTPKEKEIFVAVEQREGKKKALADAIKGIKEFEEFLEVATDLMTEVVAEDSTSITN